MDHPEGAGSERGDRVDFDRRVRLEFRGAQINSDCGLRAKRELDDALGLYGVASAALRENRRAKNTVHQVDGLFRQSVYRRLAGYEDVNDADRLALDPVMRQVVGGRTVDAQAASASHIGRFETETLPAPENRAALRQFEVGQNSADMNRLRDRLEFLQGLGLPETVLSDVPPHRIARLRRQGERYFAGDLRDISGNRRLAILAVCALEWRSAIADAIVETHDRAAIVA